MTTTAATPSAPAAARLGGLDLARGIACLTMVQAHAYDAYVDGPSRATHAYALTRFVAVLALPLFMVLAGMGARLRVQRGRDRGESSAHVRGELVRRGLVVLASGYALSVIYGLMDGARALETYLRFDVLHVIGASLMLLGALLPGRTHPTRAALLLALALLLPSPWLNALAGALMSPARFALVPFVDIAPFTLMPLVPLASWCALGAALTPLTLRHPGRVALAALPVACAAYAGMNAWVAAGDIPLSRAHPAVWLNAIDLAARALVVIGLSLVVFPRVARLRVGLPALLTLGRSSLRVYALHLPFAYGALGRSLRALPDVSVAGATPLVLALVGLTYALVRGSDWLRDRVRAKGYTLGSP